MLDLRRFDEALDGLFEDKEANEDEEEGVDEPRQDLRPGITVTVIFIRSSFYHNRCNLKIIIWG